MCIIIHSCAAIDLYGIKSKLNTKAPIGFRCTSCESKLSFTQTSKRSGLTNAPSSTDSHNLLSRRRALTIFSQPKNNPTPANVKQVLLYSFMDTASACGVNPTPRQRQHPCQGSTILKTQDTNFRENASIPPYHSQPGYVTHQTSSRSTKLPSPPVPAHRSAFCSDGPA